MERSHTPVAQQAELWDELRVEAQWYHVMRGQVLDGLISRIGAPAWAVYSILKAHTNFRTGDAFPSQQTIAELMGVSVDTVNRAMKVLLEQGIVEQRREGRKNHYFIREQIAVLDDNDQVVAYAHDRYVPAEFEQFSRALKHMAKTGDIPPGATFQLTFNVNVINQGANSTVNIQNVTVGGDRLPQDNGTVDVHQLRRKLSRL